MSPISKDEELNISNRYKKLIKWYGHSASAFAKEIGITRGALASIINGSSEPSYSTITATLSRFRELSAKWLIEGSTDMFSEETIIKIPEESEISKILRDQVDIKDQQIRQLSESVTLLLGLLNMKRKT